MHFSLIRQAFAAICVAVLVSACGGGGSSAPPPAGGITVVPGDSAVTVSWVMEPGVQYWVFYAPVSTKFPAVSTTDWINTPGAAAIVNVTSPLKVANLFNGLQYSFTVNARKSDGPGGPGTPSVAATPRLAGETWAAGGAAGSNTLRALTYGLTTDATTSTANYLAMGENGAAYKSLDGRSWNAVPAPTTAQINSTLYASARYMAVGAGGVYFYSTDLATWTAGTTNTTENLNALASNGAATVAVGDKGVIRSSTDGVAWTSATTVPTSANLYGVTYSPSGVWIAVGAGGTVLTSADALTWTDKTATTGTTKDLYAVGVQLSSLFVYNFVVAGDAGTVIISADSGTGWTTVNTGITANLRGISAGATQLLVVGEGGTIATSPGGLNNTDGTTTWTQRTSGTTAALYKVLVGLNQYLAIGAAGTNIYSQ